MNWFFFVSGIFLFGVALIDLGITALSTRGAGYLTETICKYVWKFFLMLAGRDGSRRVLEFSGMATIVLLLSVWIALIWAGNGLIVASDNNSIVNASTYASTDFWEKIYTVGYALSTMGLGDYMPAEGWRIYFSIISFTGILFLTISVTYLIPVLSAEIEKKTLSLYISCFGNSVEDLLLKSYNGKNFNRFGDLLNELEQPIIAHGQKHLTYPILNYFHNSERSKSFVINITILDQALYVLLYHIHEDIRPDTERLMRLRLAIDTFLATIKNSFIRPSDDPLTEPDYKGLCQKGLPCELKPLHIDVEEGDQVLRRKILKGLINFDGWSEKNLSTEKSAL